MHETHPTIHSPAVYRPFPVDVLPEPCRQFVFEAAAAIGCDHSYVALPMLSALAGCIGNTYVIRLKRGWDEPSIAWTCPIGESGQMKSPAQDAPLRALYLAQQEMLREHAEATQNHLREVALYEADYSAWKSTGRKQGEPPPEKPVEPVCRRVIVSDTTVEALAVIQQENPRGVLLARDELAGLLLGLNQYKGGKGSDCQHYLTMHGARPLVIDRKGSTPAGRKLISIPRAAVSICGTVQPAILQQALGREHFQDGLAARFLLAAPPPAVKRWTEAELSERTERTLAELYALLLALEADQDDQGELRPHVLPLTRSGRAAWVEFYNEHAQQQAELHGDLAAAWSKLEGYAARLALVVHLVRREWGDAMIEAADAIDAESINAGVALSRWFAREAERVYGLLRETDEERELRELVEWIGKHGGSTTARELAHGQRRYRPSGEAESALERLVKARRGHWAIDDHDGGRGQPARRFVLGRIDSGNGNTNAEIAGKTAFPLPLPPLDDINGRLLEAAWSADESED